ncbi:hypothetical protein [Streptomyces minutiscleroticus]|uniref:hypothetical protein n=1 Tax=Streptomyces minutiscleroticus TaxID=68238 RepID=UPI00331AE8E1
MYDPAVGGNSWRTAVVESSGSDVAWVNSLYLRGGEKVAGVPDCWVPTPSGTNRGEGPATVASPSILFAVVRAQYRPAPIRTSRC